MLFVYVTIIIELVILFLLEFIIFTCGSRPTGVVGREAQTSVWLGITKHINLRGSLKDKHSLSLSVFHIYFSSSDVFETRSGNGLMIDF